MMFFGLKALLSICKYRSKTLACSRLDPFGHLFCVVMSAFARLVDYFMPAGLKGQQQSPSYEEFSAVVSTVLVALPLVCLFPFFLAILDRPVTGYVINAVMIASILWSVKLFGHYRIPMSLTAAVTYVIIYGWIAESGMIYSPNLSILHMYLLGAVLADKRYGWVGVLGNLGMLGLIYYKSVSSGVVAPLGVLGSPGYTAGLHGLFTIFFGGFLSYLLYDQRQSRKRIQDLQNERISGLDLAVRQRTAQLSTIRQTIASDFHDQTGNLLSGITRQATVLELMLKDQDKALPLASGIIAASRELYASSKDFLWNLNHDSDDPLELLDYLASYGQHFFEQFAIGFSVELTGGRQTGLRFSTEGALGLILIFKESMNNAARHSGATEVLLQFGYAGSHVVFSLADNGKWKPFSGSDGHYGLANIDSRCRKGGFIWCLDNCSGTRISVGARVEELK